MALTDLLNFDVARLIYLKFEDTTTKDHQSQTTECKSTVHSAVVFLSASF